MGALSSETGSAQQGRSPYAGKGILGRVEAGLTDFAAICILLMCAYVCSGVIARNLFGSQIPDEVVIISEMMVAAVVLPLGYCAAERSFVAVEVFNGMIGPRMDAVLHVLAAVIGIMAILPITYAGFESLIKAVENGDYNFGTLNLPEWPGWLAFFLGYLMFMIRLLVLLVTDAAAVARAGGK
ncbi:MAG: TRAP transporter small permease [Thalassovita sp.]